MKCHHCHVPIFDEREQLGVINSGHQLFIIEYSLCPKCEKPSIFLSKGKAGPSGVTKKTEPEEILLYPKYSARTQAPKQVPQEIQDDYNQAGSVLEFSPQASAALCRRCLQKVLRDKGGVKPDVLSREIHQLLHSRLLPPQVYEQMQALVRNEIFTRHPDVDAHPDIIIQVNENDAELCLDLVKGLFNFYYVTR